jgi:hypothetical protein
MTAPASLPLPTELPGPGPFLLLFSYGEPVTGSFDKIVRDIRYGNIDADSMDIIWELSPRDGTMADVTLTIARAVHVLIESQGYPVSKELAQWIDNHLLISVENERAWRELIGAELRAREAMK